MGIDLPLVWAAIVAFGIALYVALDGFDLGIAILFPLVRGRADRDVMMNSVAPVWDGKEFKVERSPGTLAAGDAGPPPPAVVP